nr:Rho termination factor N-terminal domain-containing protein [Gloeomargarita lithophora]
MDEIEITSGTDSPEFLIRATAKLLQQSGGRNWLPIVVKITEGGKYQVIGNSFVYAVAQDASLERVWCVVADDKEETAFLSRVLAKEQAPKMNLSTATRDEIMAALQFLIESPNSLLKGIQLDVATNLIDEASDRKYWKDFEPITKLKCGITKTKIDALKTIFYLTPELSPVIPTETRTDDNISKMTVAQLRKLAKERDIAGTSKMNKADLLKVLKQ